MGVYRLAYPDGFKPPFVDSLEGESPSNFIRRLLDERRAAFETQRKLAIARRTLPGAAQRALQAKLMFRPLNAANVRGLLDQAMAMGDASAITPAGRLDLRGLRSAGTDVAPLRGAMMEGADFSCCDLSGVVLACAEARGTVFRDASLAGCDLGGLKAVSGNFRNADMRGADLGVSESPGWARNRPKDSLEGMQKADLTAADLRGADLSRADAKEVTFRDSLWQGARADRASFEGCDFTAAEFMSTKAREAVFFRNQLHVDLPLTVGHLDTTGGRMLLNTYFEMPNLLPLVTKKGRANLLEMIEGARGSFGPGESWSVGVDVALQCVSLALAALCVNAMLAPDDGFLTKAALTSAAVGVFALNKTVRLGISKASEIVLGRAAVGVAGLIGSRAHDSVLSRLRASGAALIALGSSARVLASEIRKRPELDPGMSFGGREGVLVLGTEEKIRGLLLHLRTVSPDGRWGGLLDASGRLIESRTFVRQVGGTLPDEGAPSRVTLSPDGTATATWLGEGGRRLLVVRYDPDGTPVRAIVPGKPGLLPEDIPHGLGGKRAVFEDFKGAVARSLCRHDPGTHFAEFRKDGTVVVKERSSRRLDNPFGPAVVRPDGTTLDASNGVPVPAAREDAELKTVPRHGPG